MVLFTGIGWWVPCSHWPGSEFVYSLRSNAVKCCPWGAITMDSDHNEVKTQMFCFWLVEMFSHLFQARTLMLRHYEASAQLREAQTLWMAKTNRLRQAKTFSLCLMIAQMKLRVTRFWAEILRNPQKISALIVTFKKFVLFFSKNFEACQLAVERRPRRWTWVLVGTRRHARGKMLWSSKNMQPFERRCMHTSNCQMKHQAVFYFVGRRCGIGSHRDRS